MSKVFGIGMFKTGTKSLGSALSILGYNGLYRPWFILKDSKGAVDNWNREPENWHKFYKQIKERAQGYNAFSDAPWMFLYRQLDEWFPGSKFILTMRKDSDTLAKSDLNQWRNKPHPPTIQQFKDRYNEHNKKVWEYFKNKNNFLVMCFERGDGWKKLCRFLDKPIPDRPFPHVNKGKYKK